MKDIPTKVVAVLGAEAGFIVGLSVIMFYTLRTVHKVTVDHRWDDLSYVTDGNIKWPHISLKRQRQHT